MNNELIKAALELLEGMKTEIEDSVGDAANASLKTAIKLIKIAQKEGAAA